MNIDLNKQGLHMFFKDWEVPLVEKLLGEYIEMDTRTAMQYVNEQIAPASVSRTSIIFSLRDMERDGILFSRQETVKGGLKRIYWRRQDMHTFLTDVTERFTERLFQGLQGKVSLNE